MIADHASPLAWAFLLGNFQRTTKTGRIVEVKYEIVFLNIYICTWYICGSSHIVEGKELNCVITTRTTTVKREKMKNAKMLRKTEISPNKKI